MTRQISFLIGAILLLQTSASAQNRPQMTDPIVHAGIFTLRPDGSIGASAMLTGDRAGADFAGTVYLAPCSAVGAADSPRPASSAATEVWQLSGRVLDLGAAQASVQITWQRTRRGGRDEPSLPQSLTLTLKRGQRSTLESIAIPATGPCAERNASLDVAFSSRSELYTSGGGTTVFDTVRDGRQLRVYGSRGDVASAGIGSTGQPAPTELTADLWLVRSTPGLADETLHLTSPVKSVPEPFVFPAMTIQTAGGVLTVKVEGTVAVNLTSKGERRFGFSTSRRVTFAANSQPVRDSGPTVEGSKEDRLWLMPGPDEVLSFEMPPLRIPGGTVVPDRLSIRVKLTPVPMREVTKPR